MIDKSIYCNDKVCEPVLGQNALDIVLQNFKQNLSGKNEEEEIIVTCHRKVFSFM